MKNVCPICKKQMLRERHWFFEGTLHRGCVYCYLNFRKEWNKRESGNQDDGESDDIL